MDAVGELIKSGRLLTDATEIGHLKSGDLLQQLQMWIHLKTIRMQVNNRDLLKGSAAAKVADKKERLRSLISPAPVAQWLARRIVGRKAWGSNPIRVMWDFSALAGSYPELGVLWAQWEGWNHTAELHPLHGCVFEGVALII